MPHLPQKPKEVVVDNTTLDRAIAANRRRKWIQRVVNSTIMKIVATVFLLSALFTASFIIAYQQIQKQQMEDALKEVPRAEITVPDIVDYVNSRESPTMAPSPTGSQGKFCGGIAGIRCPDGYSCKLDGGYPDAGGTCVPESTKTGLCKPTGCSGQICSDQDMVSTCEYKEEYACYKNATCERQADGKCGWTETVDLKACLAKNQ